MFNKDATDAERVEAAEKYFDELLRDSYAGISCNHKQINNKNVVEVFISYPNEDGGKNFSSEELIIFKGNSDEIESEETIREIS
tara:strand:- start:120 stop:371 length:252 start_codon:yes stop_codon:yes gene_type:complete